MLNLELLAKKNKTIREHTDDLIRSAKQLFEYKYIDEKLHFLLKEACEYHDYGKMNDEFQKRIKSKNRVHFNPEKEVPHNILSIAFIDRTLDEEDYLKVCYAVLNHHQHVNNHNVFNEKKELIQKFNEEHGLKNIKTRVVDKIDKLKNDEDTQILKGLLNRCDYAASGEYEIEYRNDFLVQSLGNLNYKWNKLQEFCKKNDNENIIVIANTGMGKTEAGLLWIGNNKGFFILPLKTAINAIYDRVSKKIIKENIQDRISLLHSDTLSYYLSNTDIDAEEVLDYSQKGKDFSMPLTVATLDQIFDFICLYDGFEVKLSTLSYSKLVIDEIQAYSPDLLAYLICGLKKICDVGGKFAILTATLPPFVKTLIEDKIGKVKFDKFTEGEDRHFIKVIEKVIDVDFLLDHYKENKGKVLVVCNTVKESQRVYEELKDKVPSDELNLLHAKFIKKDRSKKEEEIMKFGETENQNNGIWISTSLVEASLDIDFDYLFTELNDLNGFFQRLGRVNRKGLKKYVLGKEIKISEGNSVIEYPNVYLFTEINTNLLLRNSGKTGFIDETIYNLSKEALLNFNGVISEEEKVKLVDDYLTVEKIKDSNFLTKYQEMEKYISNLYQGEFTKDEVKKRFRDIVSYKVIPKIIYEDNMERIRELAETIKNNQNKIEKTKAKTELEGFCVSVGIYDLNKSGISVDIGYEKIEVVDCNYSFETGFIRTKKEKNITEDTFDNFF